jgi:uncharacterized Tic20 family protein
MAENTAGTGQQAQGELSKDAKMWGMLCHLSALAGLIGIPLGNILGPLIVWLIKKNDFPYVDVNGKKALNWQITMMIAAAICIPLVFACGIGVVLLIGLGIADLVFIIIASIKTNNGEDYKYPWSFNFIK